MKYIICGDFTATVGNAELFSQKDVDTLFGNVASVLKSADRVFVNVECAISERGEEIKKYGPCLRTPLEAAEVLKLAGVTDCGLSNNHIYDYGAEGATDTIETLKKSGLNVTGFGKNALDARQNLVFDTPEGKRVAVIAVSDREYAYALDDRMGARVYDEYDTMLDIIEAKKQADFVIVIYHGGKEFSRYPSPRLRKSCQTMVKLGADVVLCQHTHCIGCYENFNGGHILYGQGNFHFGKHRDDDGWGEGLITVLELSDKCDISFIPCKQDGPGIRLTTEKETKEIMAGFELRNSQLMTDEWRKGWHDVCERYRALYEGAVNDTVKEAEDPKYRQIFAHYLDCEAHCDIFRELYPTWNKTDNK